MIVGVDVGNTAVKLSAKPNSADTPGSEYWASIDLSHTMPVHVVRISEDNWVQRCAKLLDLARGSLNEVTEIRIASVNRQAADQLIHTIESIERSAERHDRLRVRRIQHTDIPMDVATQSPEKVGVDRLLGAFGASKRFQAPLVIVDAGTTVTIDWVNECGTYCGGAILPGLEMQTQSMASGTDALPHLDWSTNGSGNADASCSKIPATETLEAIRLGILSSVAGAIERLARLYARDKSENANESAIVLTGGDAECIADAMSADTINSQARIAVESHLVCRSLLDLPFNVDHATK